MMATTSIERADAIPGRSHERLIAIGKAENDALLRLLADLDDEDWSKPTDCDRWSVKDIVAHIVGMAQGFTSFKEFRHQTAGSFKRRKELGNQLNALNQTQVDDRAHLSPDELVAQAGPTFERFIKMRNRVGRPGKYIPMYDPSLLKLTNVRYLMDSIFPRDIFMHRVDITRATGKNFEFIPEDQDLVRDLVRDWARRRKPNATLQLTGAMNATFGMGAGDTKITADVVEFCRVLSGRGKAADLDISGDTVAAHSWLEQGCPF